MFEPSEADIIKQSVRQRRINEVYHYTPLRQVADILAQGGIHPRGELRRRGIRFNDDPHRWSSDPVKADELAVYVAVSIARPWGMMKDEPQCVVFGLRPQLLWRKGTAFIGGWSSGNEIAGIADVRAREQARHFDAMFDNPNAGFPSLPNRLPGEVLVLGSIDLDAITFLYVEDDQHAELVQTTVAADIRSYRGPPIKIKVAPWIFRRI